MHDGIGPGARREGCEQTVELVGKLARRIREEALTGMTSNPTILPLSSLNSLGA